MVNFFNFFFLGVAPETYESFLDCLRKDYSQETVPEFLAPLLYKDNFDISADMSIDPITKMVRLNSISFKM